MGANDAEARPEATEPAASIALDTAANGLSRMKPRGLRVVGCVIGRGRIDTPDTLLPRSRFFRIFQLGVLTLPSEPSMPNTTTCAHLTSERHTRKCHQNTGCEQTFELTRGSDAVRRLAKS